MGKAIKAKNKTAVKKATAVKKVTKKVARKCKGVAILIGLAVLLAGCAQSGPQPSRAIYQRFDVKDCRFTINAGRASTNDVPAVEMFTATQANEGSETVSPTSTPTTTVDVPVTVKYNDAIQSASAASRSVLGTIGDGIEGVLSLMQSKESGRVVVTKVDGTKACVECKDGQCSYCEDCVAPQ